MSDSEDKRRSTSGYEPASSPYDQPTERLGHDTSSLPRTDDDLDGSSRSATDGTRATEKIPTYPGPSTSSDDAATRAYPVPDATASSYGTAATPSSYDTTATPEPVAPATPVEVKERRGTLDLGLLILRVGFVKKLGSFLFGLMTVLLLFPGLPMLMQKKEEGMALTAVGYGAALILCFAICFILSTSEPVNMFYKRKE